MKTAILGFLALKAKALLGLLDDDKGDGGGAASASIQTSS